MASSWCWSGLRAAASRTLLRMLAGLEEITGGEIVIDGRVVNDLESQGPRHRDGVPELRAVSAHDGAREHGLQRCGCARPTRPSPTSAWRRAREDPQPRPAARPLSARAVGRPAPARGDGARDRARPQGVPVRRAAVQPRRQAARGDARRDQGAAPAAEDHHGLRHARPDRGDDDGRPHRRDARRHRRADRHAAGAVRPAGQPVRRAVHRLAGDERAAPARCAATAAAPGSKR